MIGRVAAVAVWLALWCAASGALYWAFLNTPESTIAALAVSGLLILALVAATAIAVNVGVLLALGDPMRASLRGAVRQMHWFVAAALPVVVAVWALLRADGWVAARAGEISAWFIATFGWADASPFFRAQQYVSLWLRWVVVPAAALAALTVLLRHGVREIATPRWIRAAWHWRTLAVATLAFALCIALPWQAASWRPAGLAPTWVEPAAAGLRLILIGTAISVGAAIILVTAVRAADASVSR